MPVKMNLVIPFVFLSLAVHSSSQSSGSRLGPIETLLREFEFKNLRETIPITDIDSSQTGQIRVRYRVTSPGHLCRPVVMTPSSLRMHHNAWKNLRSLKATELSTGPKIFGLMIQVGKHTRHAASTRPCPLQALRAGKCFSKHYLKIDKDSFNQDSIHQAGRVTSKEKNTGDSVGNTGGYKPAVADPAGKCAGPSPGRQLLHETSPRGG